MDFGSEFFSPIGRLLIKSDGKAVTSVSFSENTPCGRECEASMLAKKWLEIYFSGNAPDFTPPLSITGTPFRELIWGLLLEIPLGKTVTYGELAKKAALIMKKEKMSAQAVGGAVGHNPIGIIIPCHRVIGADGSMTGFASGVERKIFLLGHEKKIIGL